MDWGDTMVKVLGMTEGHWSVELTEEADAFLQEYARLNNLALSHALGDLIEYGFVSMKDTLVTESSPDGNAERLRNRSFTTFIKMPLYGVYADLPEDVRQDICTTLSSLIASTLFTILLTHGIGESKDELEQGH